ncbi:peptidylprolyl isomerase [Acidobacteria bacterium AH-259-O06]|nr:peptidylprolyl isomerase [Acidobacteria bacterium AH-259-O06]
MKITTFAGLGLLTLYFAVACSQEAPPTEPAPPETAEEPEAEAEKGDLVAVISTRKGDIVVKLLPELAPETVSQFVQLAKAGFYMRTTFHYVSSGFIWGGDPFSRDNDPLNDGLGNAGEWVESEFNKDHKVERGCVGMMRKDNDPNSSSCQFFIVLRRKSEWDGKYNIFGDVIEGIEVADEISKVPRVKNNRKLANRPAAKQIIRRIDIERRQPEEVTEEAS